MNLTIVVTELTPMPSKLFMSLVVSCTLSAFAGKVHDVFEANRDAILSVSVTNLEGMAYLVGHATSARNLGDAVGYAKANKDALSALVDRHFSMAPWPVDVTEDEREAAWNELKSRNPERYTIQGLQRIWSRKRAPEEFVLVLSTPEENIRNVGIAPTAEELASAGDAVRARRRAAEEAARKAAEEAARKAAEEAARKIAEEAERIKREEAARKAAEEALKLEREKAKRMPGYREIGPDGSVKQQQVDEALVL